MALKKALAQYSGKLKEIASGDSAISISTTTDADSGAVLSSVVKQLAMLAGSGTAAGTNTYTATIPEILTLSLGMSIALKITNGNTGASTLNLNGLSTNNIYKGVATPVVSGDLPAGSVPTLTFDGTNWQVVIGVILPSGASMVLSNTSAGVVQAIYGIVDAINTTPEATLLALDWSSGTVTYTGTGGQKIFGTNYEFTCVSANTWKRSIYNMIYTNLYLTIISDSTVQTSAQMASTYPNAVPGNRVQGNTGVYEYFGSNVWWYFAKTS